MTSAAQRNPSQPSMFPFPPPRPRPNPFIYIFNRSVRFCGAFFFRHSFPPNASSRVRPSLVSSDFALVGWGWAVLAWADVGSPDMGKAGIYWAHLGWL